MMTQVESTPVVGTAGCASCGTRANLEGKDLCSLCAVESISHANGMRFALLDGLTAHIERMRPWLDADVIRDAFELALAGNNPAHAGVGERDTMAVR